MVFRQMIMEGQGDRSFARRFGNGEIAGMIAVFLRYKRHKMYRRKIMTDLNIPASHLLQNPVSLLCREAFGKPDDEDEPAYIAIGRLNGHNQPFLAGQHFPVPFCDLTSFGLYFVDSR